MNDKTTQLRSLIAANDPDGRPLPDPTADPARRGYHDVVSSGDLEQIRTMVDRLLDRVDSLEEALRARVATGSAGRR